MSVINPLPILLAGPIIRRVDPNLCTIWLAFSERVSVDLSIWQGYIDVGKDINSLVKNIDHLENSLLFFPEASEEDENKKPRVLPIGTNLYIALISYEIPTELPPLIPNTIYSYNISWTTSDSKTYDFKLTNLLTDYVPDPKKPDAPNVDKIRRVSLGYREGYLPTFILPSNDVNNLKVVHGSCRKPHGFGTDGLAFLDTILANSIKPPNNDATLLQERPQQLFLTGDQIYADDVASVFLPYINALGNSLFDLGDPLARFNGEHIPLTEKLSFKCDLRYFPAFSRQKLIKDSAKLSSDDAKNHLISFAEFCAMYLMVWNVQLWPKELMDLAEIKKVDDPLLNFIEDFRTDAELTGFLSELPTGEKEKKEEIKERKEKYRKEIKQLINFRNSLPEVRRALANIPVYMIFDDHEITDDWNLTADWKINVNNSLLGKTIVRNGMMAYLLFQGWGNDPISFKKNEEANPSVNKNHELLNLSTSLYLGIPNEENGDIFIPEPITRDKVDEILGLNVTAFNNLSNPLYISNQPENRVKWHFSIRSGAVNTYFLDCRTMRKYETKKSAPGLLNDLAFKEQLDFSNPPTESIGELTFIIAQTPVFGLAIFEELIQPAAAIIQSPEIADLEAWAFHPPTIEAFLEKVHPLKKVVIFSGDVHYGFATLLDYWKKNVINPDIFEQSRVLQLVSSALKNQADDKAPPQLFISGRINQLEAESFFPTKRLKWTPEISGYSLSIDGEITPPNKIRLRKSPILLSPDTEWIENGNKIYETGDPLKKYKTPESAWQLNPLLDDRQMDELPEDIRPDDITQNDADINSSPQKFYENVMQRHMNKFKKNVSKRFVWLNNIGFVKFSKLATNQITVKQEFWYAINEDEPINSDAFTTIETSMEFTTDKMPKMQ